MSRIGLIGYRVLNRSQFQVLEAKLGFCEGIKLKEINRMCETYTALEELTLPYREQN
jgi:hypothetical protein